MNRLTASDYLAAMIPAGVTGGLSLAQVNGLIVAANGLVGLAYLLWKWNRERKQPPRSS